MNAYLVVLGQLFDVIPMALFRDHESAYAYAASLGPDLSDDMQELFTHSESVCVNVIQFANGRPVSDILLKNFDDEEE